MVTPLTDQLAGFSTSTLSDALDRLGIAGQVRGVYPVRPSMRVAGRAYTVAYQPIGVDGGTVGDFLDDVPPGSVLVLDNDGRTDATVWGDILTLVASRRGVAGTVIHGVCRDSNRSQELNYPVFSCGQWMRTGKDRVAMVDVDVPVTLGGVRVRPADVVVGDADGVVVVPAGHEARLLEVATQIEAAEQAIRDQVLAGVRLDQARASSGYHRLQSNDPAAADAIVA